MSRPDPSTREMSPCKDCTDRHEACWGKCEKYKSWKSRLDELNQRRKEYEAKPFVQYNPYNY
jgi:predicted ATP-dependent serine protease